MPLAHRSLRSLLARLRFDSRLARARFSLAAELLALCSGALLAAPISHADGDGPSFGPHDVHSVFHVEKSENQNQVHYGIRLDAECRPLGKTPVFAYWKRLKKGVRVDEPLVGAGVRLYGASDAQTVLVSASGGHVEMYVKALKRLSVDIRVLKTKDGCRATPSVMLSGERAVLLHAYLQLGRFGLTVKYVDVVGTRERDGKAVTEQFR